MKIETGKCYVTRDGIVTPPLDYAQNGTNYKWGAWIQEPGYPTGDLTRCNWLESGDFFAPHRNYRLDLIKEYEPQCTSK